MTDEIIWEEPSENALRPRPTGQYRVFAEALRTNVGRWAVLPGERKNAESARNTATNVRQGKMKDFPKGEFDVVTDDVKIFVRYTGPVVAEGEGGDPDEIPIPGAPDPKKVRAWANANGFTLPAQGRMPADVYEAYRKAHEGFSPEG